MGAMWLSGKVVEHTIQLRSDIASMETSEDIDRKQQVVMENSDHDEAYEEIEISDDEDEDEEKSDSFKKGVRKVYIKLKKAQQKYAKTNIRHFIAYIARRLYEAMGDSWHPTKRGDNKIDPDLAIKYAPWFLKCIKVASSHWDDAVSRGNAEYWLNTMKTHLHNDDGLIQIILKDLPMCHSVLNEIGENVEKIEEEKNDLKNEREKEVQEKEKKVPKNTESEGKSTNKDDVSDFETESEKSSKKKGK